MPTPITIQAYEFDELSESAKERARQWYGESDDDSYWSECVIDEMVEQGELMGIEFAPSGRKWRNAKTGTEGVDNSPRIYWSGFCSQGDGACFEGTWSASAVNADKVAHGWGESPETTQIKRIASVFAEIAKAYPYYSFKVKHSGHYYHEHCTDFDFYEGADDMDPHHPALVAHINKEDPEDDQIENARQRYAEAFPEKDLKENAKDLMRYIYAALEREYEDHNSDERVDENIKCNEYLFSEEGKRTAVLNL